jgi:UDP-GlcNAc:undecaprenyl-phosphate/decaprenyl-phosphate GlcNAc-1-phosphate transferase
MLLALLTAALVSGLASLGLTRLAMGLSSRLRFIDRPGSEAHKQQAHVVPYGGGPAMALALVLGLAAGWWVFTGRPDVVGSDPDRGPLWPMLVGAVILLLLGVRDDYRALRALPKLIIQLVVCAVAVWWSDLAIDSLRSVPVLAYGLAWAWLVVITNAFNLLDHADGLSAGCAVVSCAVLLSGSLLQPDPALALLWMGVIAALVGYLWWNRPPARVYMGDAGSLPLGFLIGCGTLSVTFWPSADGGSPLAIAVPLLITAIPIFDTAVVVVKRLRRGNPIMQGDRNHISHRLRRLGLGPAATLVTVVSLHTALAVGALHLRDGGWPVLLQCAAVLLAVILLETARDHGPG